MKIVLDIETLQASESEWAYVQGVAQAEGAESIDASMVATQFSKEYERARFDATFSRIVCIGILVLEESLAPIEAVAWCGDDETEMLQKFWSNMTAIKPTQVIAHNGLGFDLPFIIKRSIIRSVRPTIEISLTKFRTGPVYDTMAIWANWEPRSFVKLDVLARALGVEPKTGSGDQIAKLWADGDCPAIARYCLHDTYVTYGCFCKMNFREPLDSHAVLKNTAIHFDGSREKTTLEKGIALSIT